MARAVNARVAQREMRRALELAPDLGRERHVAIAEMYAGVGTMALGLELERPGTVRHAWIAETHPGAAALHAEIWGVVPNHGDATQLGGNTLGGCDILTVTSPCAPHAHANTERQVTREVDLYPLRQTMRGAASARPRLVIVESTPTHGQRAQRGSGQ